MTFVGHPAVLGPHSIIRGTEVKASATAGEITEEGGTKLPKLSFPYRVHMDSDPEIGIVIFQVPNGL